MNRNIVISTDKLTKRFGDFTAVDAISFEVSKGEIFGFLGANGAGKTTAMRMLCGLSIPSSGKATIAGFDVYKETEKIKANIGYMSQKFSLYEDLTVQENIRFFGGIYGLSDQKIKSKSNDLIQQFAAALAFIACEVIHATTAEFLGGAAGIREKNPGIIPAAGRFQCRCAFTGGGAVRHGDDLVHFRIHAPGDEHDGEVRDDRDGQDDERKRPQQADDRARDLVDQTIGAEPPGVGGHQDERDREADDAAR